MDDLPEDICRHIHALMQLRDAARTACASKTFLRSWRCRPNLTLSRDTLGSRDLISKIDHILRNHSGVGMKKLDLDLLLLGCSMDACYLNSWLHIVVKAGIEELTIYMPHFLPGEPYKFPCSLLFNGNDSPIRYLYIAICAFRPTAGLGCWRSLARLYLTNVWIADDELECLLSKCAALERLGLLLCPEIVCLKIPFMLQRLEVLGVKLCRNLQVIDSNAPNLSTFVFSGSLVPISLGTALEVKNVEMRCLELDQSNSVWHARTKLLSYAPNVETLAISSRNEMMISTPMLTRKFLHLKYLHICLVGDEAISPAYDYLSLVSFVEASPCLETFILEVQQPDMKNDSVIGDSSPLRRLPQHHHNCLKSVSIIGFCSAKSLVELTCHIVENATSLEHLTLDTSHGCQNSGGCTFNETLREYDVGNDMLMETPRAILAIRTHIEGIVPSRVALKVVEPCSRCHPVELFDD